MVYHRHDLPLHWVKAAFPEMDANWAPHHFTIIVLCNIIIPTSSLHQSYVKRKIIFAPLSLDWAGSWPALPLLHGNQFSPFLSTHFLFGQWWTHFWEFGFRCINWEEEKTVTNWKLHGSLDQLSFCGKNLAIGGPHFFQLGFCCRNKMKVLA